MIRSRLKVSIIVLILLPMPTIGYQIAISCYSKLGSDLEVGPARK